jgi:hypothetical protein
MMVREELHQDGPGVMHEDGHHKKQDADGGRDDEHEF